MKATSDHIAGPHCKTIICDIPDYREKSKDDLVKNLMGLLKQLCGSAISHFMPVDEKGDNMVQLIIHQGMHRHTAAQRFRHLCPRLFVAADNLLPDWRFDDWGISFAPPDTTNLQSHISSSYLAASHFLGHAKPIAKPEQVLREKTKFCAFVYSNAASRARQIFFHALSQHARVDGLGIVGRNTPSAYARLTGRWFEGLRMLQQPYKFAICFENLQAPDYFSEKIFGAFGSNAVPIYLGAPNITNYFNPDAFIHARDFDTPEALAKYVIRVHKDETRYLQYLCATRLQPAYQAQLKRHQDDGEAFMRHIAHRLACTRFLPKIQRNIMARELLSCLPEARVRHLIADFHNDYRPGKWNTKMLQQDWWQADAVQA